MKTIFSIIAAAFLLPLASFGQGIKAGPGTTNTPSAWTNEVLNVTKVQTNTTTGTIKALQFNTGDGNSSIKGQSGRLDFSVGSSGVYNFGSGSLGSSDGHVVAGDYTGSGALLTGVRDPRFSSTSGNISAGSNVFSANNFSLTAGSAREAGILAGPGGSTSFEFDSSSGSERIRTRIADSYINTFSATGIAGPASGLTGISTQSVDSIFYGWIDSKGSGSSGNSLGWANVTNYGALGNNSADDTAAFVAAITNPVVYVPPGTYQIRPLTLNNCVLFGDGAVSKLVMRYPTNWTMITASNSSLAKLWLDGGTNYEFTNSSLPLVLTTGLVHSAMGVVSVKDVGFSGWAVGWVATGINNIFSRQQDGYYLHNYTTNCTFGAIAANPDRADYTYWTGNRFTHGYYGFWNASAANVTVIGGVITDMVDYGLMGTNNPASFRGHSRYLGITINHTYGVKLSGAHYAEFLGNTVYAASHIDMEDSNGMEIQGNALDTPYVSFSGTGSNNIVRNNNAAGDYTFSGADGHYVHYGNNSATMGLVDGTGTNSVSAFYGPFTNTLIYSDQYRTGSLAVVASGVIFTNAGHGVTLHSNGDITSDGKTGIGINPPVFSLDVVGGLRVKAGLPSAATTDLGICLVDTGGTTYGNKIFSFNGHMFIGVPTGAFTYFVDNAGGAFVALKESTGFTGFGVADPQYRVDVSGDMNITGTYRVNGTPISSGGSSFPLTQDTLILTNNTAGIGKGIVLTTNWNGTDLLGLDFYYLSSRSSLYMSTNGGHWNTFGLGEEFTFDQGLTVTSLAGTGTRPVGANANGTLTPLSDLTITGTLAAGNLSINGLLGADTLNSTNGYVLLDSGNSNIPTNSVPVGSSTKTNWLQCVIGGFPRTIATNRLSTTGYQQWTGTATAEFP